MATDNKNKILTTEGCGCADSTVHSDSASGPGTDSPFYPNGVPDNDGPPPSVGDYTAWGTIPKSIGAATGDWEGQFNSYLRAGSGWLIGYLNETNVPYTSDLSELNCSTDVMPNIVNVSSGVIGFDTTSTPGYYQYTPPGMSLNIFRLVVLYKYCDDGTITAYVIKVTDLQSIQSAADPDLWLSEVDYDYRCFNCEPPAHRKHRFNNALINAFKANKKVQKSK